MAPGFGTLFIRSLQGKNDKIHFSLGSMASIKIGESNAIKFLKMKKSIPQFNVIRPGLRKRWSDYGSQSLSLLATLDQPSITSFSIWEMLSHTATTMS